MLGKTLDHRYRIERVLGTGAMGSVYAAEDLRAGRTVAVKVIHRHLAGGTPILQRFAREARAAGSIDTPHIARCFDTGTNPDDGSPYMVLEYLDGEDLQSLLRRLGPLPPEVALRVSAQTCLGVQRAHEASVVHRDIKPANIFLARSEGGVRVVKVLDFGVAKILHDEDEDPAASATGGLTRTGSILGSPLYMSPEQARSVKNVDARSDVWSLGVVLYQSLAGRAPYQDVSGLGDLILALCTDAPPPVQGFAPWVAPEIATVVDRALQVVPDDRFQSVAEMRDALRALLPAGTELRDEMLVALDGATRDRVAAAYVRRRGQAVASPDALALTAAVETPSAAPPPRSSATSAPELALEELAGPPHRSAPPTTQITQSAVATTGPGLADSVEGRPPVPPRPRPMSTLAVAIACVVAGGGAVYAFTRPTAVIVSPAAPVSAATVAPSPIAPKAEPTSAPTPSESASSPAPSSSETSSPIHAPPPTVTGPAPSAPTSRGRSGHPAPAASAPRVAPLDYSSFGGRK